MSATSIFIALAFPTYGLQRGIHAITSLAVFADTELKTAARARALCMVVERPLGQYESPLCVRIHGRLSLPDGYGIISVPGNATFRNDKPTITGKGLWRRLVHRFQRDDQAVTQISCNYSVVKIVVALGQTLFAVGTLYRAQGHQVDLFGYSAFGLTVAPYAWMSVINLLGLLMCPEYPARYLVESEALRKLRARQTSSKQEAGTGEVVLEGTEGYMEEEIVIEGIVGVLTSESEEAAQPRILSLIRNSMLPTSERLLNKMKGIVKPRRRALLNGVVLAVGLVPVATIGGISRFRRGTESTSFQRAVTMSWLALGIILGTLIGASTRTSSRFLNSVVKTGDEPQSAMFTMITFVISLAMFFVIFALLGTSAILGFVVVGQEILQYGVCIRI
ncbi:MAG: hypothetical protein M1840_004352 [Geoglossum simile]|nr:MAG: hypothetical protein M1840_004352 [Geoglossum simile]